MTEQDVRRRLTLTLTIVAEAKVPVDLLPSAFTRVWDELGDDESPAGREDSGSRSRPGGATDARSKLAAKLAVSAEAVGDIFQLAEDGRFKVDVPSRRLARGASEATRQLALLVCAANQYETNEPIALQLVRDACEDHNIYDGSELF